MLKQTGWPERAFTLFTKKMAGMEDFYSEEDFDAILAAIEDNLLEENKEFSSPVDLLVEEVEHHHPATEFSCDECDKVCKTSRGLTRHKDAIHKEVVCGPSVSGKLLVTPESLLHPLYFNKYVNQSAAKLAIDECYSERLRKEFVVYSIDSDYADVSY